MIFPHVNIHHVFHHPSETQSRTELFVPHYATYLQGDHEVSLGPFRVDLLLSPQLQKLSSVKAEPFPGHMKPKVLPVLFREER